MIRPHRYMHVFMDKFMELNHFKVLSKYLNENEAPSPRFYESVHAYYQYALEVEDYSIPLTRVMNSCTHNSTNEDEVIFLRLKLHSYVNYMRHAVQFQALNIDTFNGQFSDYLSMKMKIHKHTDFDYYPKPSLRLAHDIASRDFNLIKQEVERASFNERVEHYGKILSFTPKNGDLVFVQPQSPEDVIEEGKNLNHCVGSYVSRISNGKTYIMFLRHKDALDESMYTVEVDENFNIIQTQGKHRGHQSMVTSAISQYRTHLKTLDTHSLVKDFSAPQVSQPV